MQLRIYIMTLVFLLFGTSVLAQEREHTEICIDFRVNKTVIDTTYMDNAASLQEMKSFLQTVLKDTAVNIVEVSLCAAASPEGNDQLNRRLAQGRLATLEKLVRNEMYLPDSIITRNDSYIPWNYMRSQVEHSDLPQKDKVLSILDEESRLVNYYYPNTHVDSRLAKLKLLNDGYVWRQMEKRFFAQMRNACIVFVTEKKIQPAAPIEKKIETVTPEPTPVVPDTIAPQVTDSIEEQPILREPMLSVRTNLLYDLATAVNVGVEYYTRNPHWSILAHYTFPWWSNRKNHLFMQVLDGCIEPRFYFDGKAGHTGHYLSVYGQANLYDIGFNEELGWQGEGWSFGLGYGRVWQPWKNKKWKLEAFIRVGYYHSIYDPYHAGEPGNDKYYYDWEGLIENFVRRNHRLRWFGPTGLGITLSYDLLNRKVIKERK